MGSASAAFTFAYTPDFHKGLSAAGRIMQLLNRKSKILDPEIPATEDFVSTTRLKQYYMY